MTNELPKLCYTFIRTNPPGERIGLIKRGQTGYYKTDFDRPTISAEAAADIVSRLNNKMQLTCEQVSAMEAGSRFGFDVPGADPCAYA